MEVSVCFSAVPAESKRQTTEKDIDREGALSENRPSREQEAYNREGVREGVRERLEESQRIGLA